MKRIVDKLWSPCGKLLLIQVILAFLFLVASVGDKPACAGAWKERAGSATDGGVSNNTNPSMFSSLTLDSNNNPHVAWMDSSDGDWEIYYTYWDGNSWETFGGANTGGGVSNNAGNSESPSLILDSNNNPHIAWYDNTGGDWDIYYAYWDGDSWETYGGANTGGGVSNNAGISERPFLTLDSLGNPHIAWGDSLGIYYAY